MQCICITCIVSDLHSIGMFIYQFNVYIEKSSCDSLYWIKFYTFQFYLFILCSKASYHFQIDKFFSKKYITCIMFLQRPKNGTQVNVFVIVLNSSWVISHQPVLSLPSPSLWWMWGLGICHWYAGAQERREKELYAKKFYTEERFCHSVT
jgi:hypothetical protein